VAAICSFGGMAARAELERQRRLLRELATNSGEIPSPLARFMQSLPNKSAGWKASSATGGENSNSQPSFGWQPNSLDLLAGTTPVRRTLDGTSNVSLNFPGTRSEQAVFATTAAAVSDLDTSYEERSLPQHVSRSRAPHRNVKSPKRRIRSASAPRQRRSASTPSTTAFRSQTRPPPAQDEHKALQVAHLKLQTGTVCVSSPSCRGV
jgi:hypothetical protein